MLRQKNHHRQVLSQKEYNRIKIYKNEQNYTENILNVTIKIIRRV